MKTKIPNSTPSGQVSIFTGLSLALLLSVSGGAPQAHAGQFVKANNADTLNLATSWTNNAVPGADDIVQWDNTITDPNNATDILGANAAWGGIKILNPAGPVTISAGSTLTLGAGGIDLSGATADLTLASDITLPDYTVQTWNVPAGRTLSLSGAFTRSGGAALNFNGDGLINITAGTASSVLGYGLVNGTDVAALDASLNVSTVNAVIGYIPNPSTGVPSSQYMDVNTSIGATGNDWYTSGSTTYYPLVVRFDTPNPNRNYWQLFGHNLILLNGNKGPNTILVTTNVGACDIILTGDGSGGATIGMRQTSVGSEFIFDQENTLGSLYINLGFSVKSQLAGNMFTKRGAGRVVVNTDLWYPGPTRILEGELQLNGVNQDNSVITVSPGATFSGAASINTGSVTNNGTLWPGNNGAGVMTVAKPLTMNADSGLKFYSATVNATNTAAALNLTDNFTVNGAVSVSIVAAGAAVGQYPLLHWTNAISAETFANFSLVAMPLRTSGYLSNNVANNSIDLVVTNVDEPVSWAAGNGDWDVNGTANWVDLGSAATTYQEAGPLGDAVLFDDTASGASPITVTLNTSVHPAAVTVNNAAKNYIISGSGGITGGVSVTKTGAGSLSLQTINDFTGGMNFNGGLVTFSSLSNLGAGALNFGGGTLQYPAGDGEDISVRTVTFNAGGGTIDDGGNALTFANPIGNAGAGGFTKIGSGTMTLNGTNNYSGPTVIGAGTLALGYGANISNSAAIMIGAGAKFDVTLGDYYLTLNPDVNQVLGGVGSFSGILTAPAGTTISPATNGVFGTLTLVNDLTVSGAGLALDVANTNHDLIAVGGSLSLNSGAVHLNVIGTLTNGVYKLIQYAGGLVTGSGSSGNLALTGFSQPGQSAILSDATSGEIDLVVSASASDAITWSGTGSVWDQAGTTDWLLGGVTPWAFTNGDLVTFDESGLASPNVSLASALLPGSVTVNNSTATYIFADGTGTGGGKISGPASLVKDGAGTLILQTANDYTGSTTIKNGTVQVGSGSIGDIGAGNVTNNGALVFNQGDNNVHTVSGAVSGTGTLTQQGSSTLVLAKGGSYSGATTISSGALQFGNGGAVSLPTGNITNNGALILNGADALTIPGITGSGALIKAGTATATIAGGLTYQGNTYISNGVVKLTAADQIPDASSVAGSTGWLILDGGATAGTLDLNGFDETVNALSGLAGTVNGMITNSSSAVTTNTLKFLNAAATTYNGLIAEHAGGTGAKIGLLVTGPNTLTLNPPAKNAYSGGIVVSNSSLAFGNVQDGSLNAPGTGPITLLGTNASLYTAGSGGSTGPTYTPLTNTVIVPAGQTASIYGPSRGAVGCALLGAGTLYYNSTYVRDSISGDWSAFTGPITLSGNATGGNIGLNLTNGFPNSFVTLNTNVALYATVAGTPTVPIGALAGGDASCLIESTTSGNAGGVATIFAIGGLNASTAYGGGIIDNVGLLKVGAGTFTLHGGDTLTTNVVLGLDGVTYYTNIVASTNTVVYTGGTTVSNGTLALVLPVVLTNSTSVTLASADAVLDASAMGYVTNEYDYDFYTLTNAMNVTNGIFEVVSGQSFNGIGTLIGNLQADAGSTLNPGNVAGNPATGSGTGILTVNGSATLNGTVNFRLNTTNAVNGDELAASSYAISGATLVVANVGPAFTGSNVFHLFSSAVDTNGFVSMTLPASDSSQNVINNLAVDGTVVITSLVNNTPANLGYSISGNVLTLTWPADHTGWTLQMQTNDLSAGLGTNWINVPGSAGVNSTNIPVDPAKPAVFFRLVYP
jgi:autotransporter-associated beta strand protein